MSNPYADLPDHAFWRRSVAGRPAQAVDPVVAAPFAISPDDAVATAGSCFAQHISRALVRRGYNYLVTETGEGEGYGVFPARFGNIYAPRQLLQTFDRAYGLFEPRERAWRRPDGAWVDPFRPQVEPAGFATMEALEADRAAHLAAVRTMFETCAVFIFTLGLTEAWRSRKDGSVYPICPGVQAGAFDAKRHEFVNYGFNDVIDDMRAAIAMMREINPALRLILTVSPVPLTATASGNHVLPATTYSKSTLRAVAGDMADAHEFVWYFPSYEIIVSPTFRGMFYLPNPREVSIKGVEFVMTHVFAGLNATPAAPGTRPAPAPKPSPAAPPQDDSDVTCEEAMLEAFGR